MYVCRRLSRIRFELFWRISIFATGLMLLPESVNKLSRFWSVQHRKCFSLFALRDEMESKVIGSGGDRGMQKRADFGYAKFNFVGVCVYFSVFV